MSLLDDICGINAIDHVMSPLDSSKTRSNPGTVIDAPVEGSSPTADTGTAGVSDLYPVTCAARYYEAASVILEDEGKLAGNPHDNANKLGALIQQWIERARDNWEPK